MTRRTLFGCVSLLVSPPRLISASTLAVQYRAHATVLLLGMPVLRRDNVGSGYLHVDENHTGPERFIRLEFGAGSLPERAAGLNRLGIFEEEVVESSTGKIESISYFGYMTTSNEKDLKQATDALEKGGDVSYSAIRGNIEKGKFWNRLMKIRDTSKAGWQDRGRLTPMIRARLSEESSAEAQHTTASLDGAPCGTFLHAIRGAMRSESPKSDSRFVHNGKVHRLRTEKSSMDKTGVATLEGRILSEAGKALSEFKLSFEPRSQQPYPLRFEFRARSFLRLTFERV